VESMIRYRGQVSWNTGIRVLNFASKNDRRGKMFLLPRMEMQ
jgi:hypothetical protein